MKNWDFGFGGGLKVTCVAISEDCKWIFIGDNIGQLIQFDFLTKEIIGSSEKIHGFAVSTMVLTRDIKYLFTGCIGGS